MRGVSIEDSITFQWVRDGVEQSFRFEPRFGEQLGLIISRIIAEDSDHFNLGVSSGMARSIGVGQESVMLEFLCEFDGGKQVESRAQAQAEPVQIDQFEEQPERVVVGDEEGSINEPVSDFRLQVLRHATLSNSLRHAATAALPLILDLPV